MKVRAFVLLASILLPVSALAGGDPRTAEARTTIGQIAKNYGAALEREDRAGKPRSKRKLVSFPAVPNSVPRGAKYQSSMSDWVPWAPIGFSLEEPQRFQYEVRAASDGQSAEVLARGDLNGDGKTSLLQLHVEIDPKGCCLRVAPNIVDGSAASNASAAAVQTFTGKDIVEQMSFANVKATYANLDFTTLYHADINNDGVMEFILCEKNSTGLHNDQILGIYLPAPSSGVMTGSETPRPHEGPFGDGNITFLGSPFLRADPEGITMTFVEGNQRARYLWKGGHIRLLDRR